MLAAGTADSYAGSGASTEVFQAPQRVSAHVASIQVPEIFHATTPANPWPHVLSTRELRGLARESYRAHRTLYPRDRRAARGVCRNLFGAPQCVVVNRSGLAVRGVRVLRLYEDGSGRIRFFVPDMD